MSRPTPSGLSSLSLPRVRRPLLSTRNLGAAVVSTTAAVAGIGFGAGPAGASLGHRNVYWSPGCVTPGAFGDGPVRHGFSTSNYGAAKGGCDGSGYIRIGLLSSHRRAQFNSMVNYGTARSSYQANHVGTTAYTRLRSTDASAHKTQGVSHYAG